MIRRGSSMCGLEQDKLTKHFQPIIWMNI
jgi:hypothetical protein